MKRLPNAITVAACMLMLLVCCLPLNHPVPEFDASALKALQNENDSLRQQNTLLNAELHRLDSLATIYRQHVAATKQTINQLQLHAHESIDSIQHFSARSLYGYFSILNPDTTAAW